jgi:hypothetical protein
MHGQPVIRTLDSDQVSSHCFPSAVIVLPVICMHPRHLHEVQQDLSLLSSHWAAILVQIRGGLGFLLPFTIALHSLWFPIPLVACRVCIGRPTSCLARGTHLR